jgi:hypothetical protein
VVTGRPAAVRTAVYREPAEVRHDKPVHPSALIARARPGLPPDLRARAPAGANTPPPMTLFPCPASDGASRAALTGPRTAGPAGPGRYGAATSVSSTTDRAL